MEEMKAVGEDVESIHPWILPFSERLEELGLAAQIPAILVTVILCIVFVCMEGWSTRSVLATAVSVMIVGYVGKVYSHFQPVSRNRGYLAGGSWSL